LSAMLRNVIPVVFLVLIVTPIALAQTATTNTTVTDMLATALENPRFGIAIAIQFILGAALGYLAVKVVRYILAFIAILILGSALSVWSLGGSAEEIAKQLGVEVAELLPVLKQLIFTVGLTIVGPASLGFIVGVIIAMVFK